MPSTTAPIVFRGQYRPRGSQAWTTFLEKPSEPSCWDELLTATTIPRGADLRVVKITASPAEHRLPASAERNPAN